MNNPTALLLILTLAALAAAGTLRADEPLWDANTPLPRAAELPQVSGRLHRQRTHLQRTRRDPGEKFGDQTMKRILVLFTTLLLAPLAGLDPIGQRRTYLANLRVAILSYRSGIRQNSLG